MLVNLEVVGRVYILPDVLVRMGMRIAAHLPLPTFHAVLIFIHFNETFLKVKE